MRNVVLLEIREEKWFVYIQNRLLPITSGNTHGKFCAFIVPHTLTHFAVGFPSFASDYILQEANEHIYFQSFLSFQIPCSD